MKSFLYAVQDGDGHEIASVRAEVVKVSDVEATFEALPDGWAHVRILVNGTSVKEARTSRKNLTLHRVSADDKLAKPVTHPLKEHAP